MDPEMAHDQHGKTGTEKCSWESAKDSQTATRIIFCSAPLDGEAPGAKYVYASLLSGVAPVASPPRLFFQQVS